MQPERINPELNQKGYNVKSDVWSLGITMVLSGLGAALAAPVGWGLSVGVPGLSITTILSGLGTALAGPVGWGVSVLGSMGSKSFKSQKKEFLVSKGGKAPSNISVWVRGLLEVTVPLS